jgi:hypothetical protein
LKYPAIPDLQSGTPILGLQSVLNTFDKPAIPDLQSGIPIQARLVHPVEVLVVAAVVVAAIKNLMISYHTSNLY